jgi:hypothetical protein
MAFPRRGKAKGKSRKPAWHFEQLKDAGTGRLKSGQQLAIVFQIKRRKKLVLDYSSKTSSMDRLR